MALVWKMICKLGDPMSLRHPVAHVSATSHAHTRDISLLKICTVSHTHNSNRLAAALLLAVGVLSREADARDRLAEDDSFATPLLADWRIFSCVLKSQICSDWL